MNEEKNKLLGNIIEQECELYDSYSNLLIKELKKPKQDEIKRQSKVNFMNDLNCRNIEVKI
jgi:hypothetical protein